MRKRIFYHYKMVSSSLWNTFIPDTMKKIDPKQSGWKRWFNLSHDKPWEKEEELQFGIQGRKIHPDEYMQKGWNQGGYPEYLKGSRHNKIGMWIMWTYYVLIIGMVIRLIWTLNT